MDLRDLLDVKAICDAGSFRKAAQALGVAQPTLSNRIAYLEGKLGAPLFERDRSRSRPTKLAEIIASRATGLGQDVALLSKDIARLAAGRTGTVRIGFGAAVGRILLDQVIALATARFPELSVSLVCYGDTRQLGEQLRSGDLDIVVCHPFDVRHPSIAVEQEVEMGNVLVAHPQHAIFRGTEPSLRDIVRNVPLAITVLEKRYEDMALELLGIDINQLHGSVICSDFELLIRLVTSRPWYFTAGPEFAFEPELASGKLRKLASPVPFGHRIAIHTNRDALPLPAVTQVQQIIRELFAATLGPNVVT
jgi:DNA-binding transcriptional LysR family regulator